VKLSFKNKEEIKASSGKNWGNILPVDLLCHEIFFKRFSEGFQDGD
jgi:hypothetical protein